MEINQRMSKRFAWLLGVVVLVSIGVLVACGSNYNASSDGLVLVGSQGSGLIETFSFNLNNGGSSAISNTPADTSGQVCVLNGIPSSLVVDPKGAYAYTIINANPSCDTATVKSTTGILVFKINSDGTTTQVGNKQVPFNAETVVLQGTTTVDIPKPAVVPGTMVMDPAGKFLFVADRTTTDSNGLYVPGAVSVFAIGSAGSVTEVAGSPFITSTAPSTLPQAGLDIISVAPTPTVFPAIGLNGVQNSVCSAVGLNPPTSQYLYAVDRLGSQVFEFTVETTSGALTFNPAQPLGADALPAGIAVDPCNRFVYVTGSLNGRINAYTICNGGPNQSSTNCPTTPDGSLVEVAGSPFSLAGTNIQAGPLVVDPYGNHVYVLGTHSNSINILNIAPVSGALAAANPATVATGLGPTSIAIRGDDNWMFVTNYSGPSVSQYSITPATGALNALSAIQTDNYPWGVAVK
jgi:6-phosphogluconolactonase (cycloisomerase 2 family)